MLRCESVVELARRRRQELTVMLRAVPVCEDDDCYCQDGEWAWRDAPVPQPEELPMGIEYWVKGDAR